VESRKIQRNIVQERSLALARFRDYAQKLRAPIIEAEDKKYKYDH